MSIDPELKALENEEDELWSPLEELEFQMSTGIDGIAFKEEDDEETGKGK